MEGKHTLYFILITFTNDLGAHVLKDIQNNLESTSHTTFWNDARELGLQVLLAEEWKVYILQFKLGGILLTLKEDTLTWIGGFHKG